MTVETGKVRKRNDVTTPKLPPPPPRLAQKRSAFSDALHVRTRPDASTSVRPTMLSDVVPCRRELKPTPPPSASPAMPTVGHEPPGIVRPLLASAA